MADDIPRIIRTTVLKRIESFENNLRRSDITSVGRVTISAMKERIAQGKGTIKGGGNFKAYRGGYRKAINRGSIRGKALRPVNLKLSGDFLKDLTFKLRKGSEFPSLRIGFFKKKSILKEQGHRDGHNGQAKRPIVPNEKEEFVRPIQTRINNEIQRVVDRALARSR